MCEYYACIYDPIEINDSVFNCCDKHVCQKPECYEIICDEMDEDGNESKYCIMHTCSFGSCINMTCGIIDGTFYRYCEKHTCSKYDCNNVKFLDAKLKYLMPYCHDHDDNNVMMKNIIKGARSHKPKSN